jgi:diacylglycerol kinase family enzyme
MKHLFVVNPVSFNQKSDMDRILEDIRGNFARRGEEPSFHVSRYPRDAIAVIRGFASAGAGEGGFRVYAVGGDGILFDCLNGIVGLPGAELGALPYGKSNDFIRAFGEGVNGRFRDIAAQMEGTPIPCDVIYAGNNFALNTCTIGLESYAAHKASELHKQYRPLLDALPRPVSSALYGLLFFIGGVLSINNKTLINQEYRISVDGKDMSGHFAIINIANGPCYGGDKNAAVSAQPDDGYLDVLLFKSTGIFSFISKGFDYLYGKYRKYPDLISYIRAREITVSSDLPLMLQLDGEVFIDTNITVRIVPDAVKFVSVGDMRFRSRWATAGGQKVPHEPRPAAGGNAAGDCRAAGA